MQGVRTPGPVVGEARMYQVGRRSREEMRAFGRSLRGQVPRSSTAGWQGADNRMDPVERLRSQEAARVPDLVPVRYQRMGVSPFTFLRATANVMAADLAPLPHTGINVQACGDAHMLNFGVYASPERHLVFDVNDFDETTPAPWEWDVKRLAASLVVGCRDQGLSDDVATDVVRTSVRHYRQRVLKLSVATTLDIYNSHLTVEDMISDLWLTEAKVVARRVEDRIARSAEKARTRTGLQALQKFTRVTDGRLRFIEQPPLIQRLPDREVAAIHELLHQYAGTLTSDRRLVLEQYEVVDAARKVVGVGSVGLRADVVLLQGRGDPDPLFLQIKQATHSALAPYVGRSAYFHMGHRVVAGQRIMQAVSDPFLGWSYWRDVDVYVRQLRDMKGQAQVFPEADFFLHYGGVCGSTLARAHSRSVDPAVLAGYLGESERFDDAIARFALAYADQNERDYERFTAAVRAGRLG